MEQKKRKHIRLKEYDYSQNGAYFVTICTENRAKILSEISYPALTPNVGKRVGPDALIGPELRLTEIGRVVEKYILRTEQVYHNVAVEHYVIMPNHIHLLLLFTEDGPMRASGPTLGRVIKALKRMVTRELGNTILQSNYYEHIIRNEEDFQSIWTYIDQNPAKWAEDDYYTPQGGTP